MSIAVLNGYPQVQSTPFGFSERGASLVRSSLGLLLHGLYRHLTVHMYRWNL